MITTSTLYYRIHHPIAPCILHAHGSNALLTGQYKRKPDDRYRRRRYVKMHSASKISFNTTGQTDIGLTEVLISVTDIPHVAKS